ncbi:MAG: DUF2231 domain-containing protein [Campylobacterota bacterium]|nr:DUF2231 domain-containing protein [Campylobacterota bacterium]
MMLHPATVHFAMVLPLVALVFGLIYLVKRDEAMSKLSSRITVVAAIAMGIAWYTGSQAGPEVYDYLSEAGQKELMEHKSLGLYLAIAMGVIALLKFLGCQLKSFMLEALAVLLLFGATAVTFAQGKDGGEIVYNYGMPFKSYMIEDSLYEAQAEAEEAEEDSEKLEIYEDVIDDVKMISEDVDTIYGNEKKESNE